MVTLQKWLKWVTAYPLTSYAAAESLSRDSSSYMPLSIPAEACDTGGLWEHDIYFDPSFEDQGLVAARLSN